MYLYRDIDTRSHNHWCSGMAINIAYIWCDFDRASSLICGNKMRTRCNRGFYCRSYCLLVSDITMPIIRSSRVLYSGCCLWYFVLWFSNCWSGVELRVMCPVCRMLQHPANRTHNPQLHTRPATWKTTARNTTSSNHCIILLSSWWWA